MVLAKRKTTEFFFGSKFVSSLFFDNQHHHHYHTMPTSLSGPFCLDCSRLWDAVPLIQSHMMSLTLNVENLSDVCVCIIFWKVYGMNSIYQTAIQRSARGIWGRKYELKKKIIIW